MLTSLGLRHVALNVRDPQVSKHFYTSVLKMEIEWEPDPDNVYLRTPGTPGAPGTSGSPGGANASGAQDNLALHKSTLQGTLSAEAGQRLDHIGFALPTPEVVDEWYQWVRSHDVKILREVKTHRDGARSFYFEDPDGVIIQMIYHPPIAGGAEARA